MASGLRSVHHKKLGPAPIASFEDLSDEVENGDQNARMPGILEVTTPVTPGSSLKAPSTPRIDISRASSSSHHEDSNNSRESSPERELLAGAEPPPGCKLTLGYKEDAQDLRSSTEELDLQDPIHEQDLRRDSKKSARKRKDGGSLWDPTSGIKPEDERERKDSNCSEIILLNISGRTSRLSSVGSQGSGVSGKLSVVSANSSRSPSPHKCLLETSFCGSKPTLVDNSTETSKPETDDLEKILLKREADTTKALIPESIKVPIVEGNLKADPLDKPRRRGREERKEIFRREVEITKRFLEKVNIEVPVIAEQPGQHTIKSEQEIHKPATLDFNDVRKKAQSYNDVVLGPSTCSSITSSPKLSKHQKIRELEGSRTPSPSSVSRRSSFASLFKTRTDGCTLSPDSPTSGVKSFRNLTSKLKDTTESIRSRSKSRERISMDKGSSSLKKESKNKGVLSSTLSLFKKRERKKSYDEAIAVGSITEMSKLSQNDASIESIGHVEFTFDTDRDKKKGDGIFVSLHADDRNYEVALPSESVSIPLETPTKLLDEYESQPHGRNIVTEASIEHCSFTSKIEDASPIAAYISKENRPIHAVSKEDTGISKSSSIDSTIVAQSSQVRDGERPESDANRMDGLETSNNSLKESTVKKSGIAKPARKNKEIHATENIEREPIEKNKTEMNGNVKPVSRTNKETKKAILDAAGKSSQDISASASIVSDLDHNSSESERDSEMEFIRNKAEKMAEELPDERKGLFYEESFEEDLPYVPTTLPLEKSVAVPMLPVKQRVHEVRTIPIERPRSTTPINPTLLDEFVMQTSSDERRAERMKISLPREDSFKLKSPRKHTANTFSEFAEKVPESIKRNVKRSPSPPPLPPRAPMRPSNWINFEEIPEKRKAPKRIQTIPRTEDDDKAGYSYVQPEECRCECHEESRRASLREAITVRTTSSSCSRNGDHPCNGENCIVPASSGDRASIVSDSSVEGISSMDDQISRSLLGSSKPFGMDLDIRSNRSSVISQEETDETINQ